MNDPVDKIKNINPAGAAFEKSSFSKIVLRVGILIAGFALLGYVETIELNLTFGYKLILGWGLLTLLVIFKRIRIFNRAPWRVIFLIISALISLRYMIWRTNNTLLFTNVYDLIGMSLLFFAEVYALVIHLLGMFVNIWPVVHKIMPLPEDTAAFPSVDIFIPTYTEPEEIVKITAIAATQIDYPKEKMNIYILDDGSTIARRNNPETAEPAWERYYSLKRLAEKLCVNYLTREKNNHAKAGNINAAIGHSKSDLILVLDCDHVPTKDILKSTAGWFLEDKKLFLVQTPHFFMNATPIDKIAEAKVNIPGENDMFYHVIHHGLDAWNSSYFCGSAAVIKRSYLVEAGGISGETITEDAETSIHLHNKGYNSVYIDKPMVCGLSPETFDDYIVQRTRWAQGMMQLFLLKNPLTAKGLTLPQRISYFNSCFFWFFGIARFIFYIMPPAFLIFGLRVYHATVEHILLYAVPHVIGAMVTMQFLYGRARKPFFSEIYESVQAIFLMPAVISVLINPRKPMFKITPKGVKLDKESLNPMATGFAIMTLINIVGLVFGVQKYIDHPLYRNIIMVTGAWASYNLLMSILSLGAFWEKKQVRSYHRMNAKGSLEIFITRLNISAQGSIRDMSLRGIGFEITLDKPMAPMEDIVISTTDSYGNNYKFNARVPKAIKKGPNKYLCGAELILDEKSYADAVSYVFGDSKRWTEAYQRKARPIMAKHMVALLTNFFFLGLKGALHIAIDYLIYIYRILSKHVSRFYKNNKLVSMFLSALRLRKYLPQASE